MYLSNFLLYFKAPPNPAISLRDSAWWCVFMRSCGLCPGRGGADRHDEAQGSDGARRGHAGVSGGHYWLLSPQGAHPHAVPTHRAAERAEGREGDAPSHTSCCTTLPLPPDVMSSEHKLNFKKLFVYTFQYKKLSLYCFPQGSAYV